MNNNPIKNNLFKCISIRWLFCLIINIIILLILFWYYTNIFNYLALLILAHTLLTKQEQIYNVYKCFINDYNNIIDKVKE